MQLCIGNAYRGRTNNFPESGRGLGHATPTIFGSTVGYPSDSLASCYIYIHNGQLIMLARYMHCQMVV